MTELTELKTFWASDFRSVCVGRVVEINAEGRAVVDFPGNRVGPVEARFVSLGWLPIEVRSLSNATVLLVFENGDPALPIIVGPILETLSAPTPDTEHGQPSQRRSKVGIDARNLVLEAKEEVLLRCGESSLSLKKDGKIVVKGSRIVSRASRTNKIRGASVAIN